MPNEHEEPTATNTALGAMVGAETAGIAPRGLNRADRLGRQASTQSGFSIGDRIRVDDGPLRLRDGPGLDAGVVRELATGEEACVVGGPQLANAHDWYQVRTSTREIGWLAGAFCTLVGAGACGFEPGDRIAVTDPPLRLRDGAGLEATTIDSLAAGVELCITDTPRGADGYRWYPVRTEAGEAGWVAGAFCGLVEAAGCDGTASTGANVGAAFSPTGPRFAGGNLDAAARLINASAARHRVPANFLAAIIAHESTGDWRRDGSRFSFIRPQAGPLLPYIGVFENTAISRTGMSSAQFRALLGDQAGQIDLLGAVLRSQFDQLKRMNRSFNWLNVASFHFSGNPVPTGFCDELGNCDDRYVNNIRDWWGILEPGFDPDPGAS
jgi:hypothetical protein